MLISDTVIHMLVVFCLCLFLCLHLSIFWATCVPAQESSGCVYSRQLLSLAHSRVLQDEGITHHKMYSYSISNSHQLLSLVHSSVLQSKGITHHKKYSYSISNSHQLLSLAHSSVLQSEGITHHKMYSYSISNKNVWKKVQMNMQPKIYT